MARWRTAGLVVAIWIIAGLGLYEMTAKSLELAVIWHERTSRSPGLDGVTLPGWWAADRAEKAIRWSPPTGLLPLDKLLHEGEEAAYFYATLAGYRPQRVTPARAAPDRQVHAADATAHAAHAPPSDQWR